MAAQHNLTQDEVKKRLNYNPKTGIFTWNEVVVPSPVKVGDIAGGHDKDGYVQIWIRDKVYFAHRLAFLYYHGYLPENDVDHINRNKSDNRIDNLREVSRSCNMQNSRVADRNTSGYKGVSLCKASNKWSAYITVNYKQYSLGKYKSPLEAALARITAEDCLDEWHCDENSESRKRAFSQLERVMS